VQAQKEKELKAKELKPHTAKRGVGRCDIFGGMNPTFDLGAIV